MHLGAGDCLRPCSAIALNGAFIKGAMKQSKERELYDFVGWGSMVSDFFFFRSKSDENDIVNVRHCSLMNFMLSA